MARAHVRSLPRFIESRYWSPEDAKQALAYPPGNVLLTWPRRFAMVLGTSEATQDGAIDSGTVE